MQGMGISSSIGSSSPMRPGGISAQHQQRPLQSSIRPPSSPNSQPPATQVSTFLENLFIYFYLLAL